MVLFFYLIKIGIFVYSYWRSTVVRKKGNGLLVLPIGLFLIIFQMFQFFFFAHCFTFFNQMTIIYLSLKSCWYIWPNTRISLCILGYICIFISNLFFSLLCYRVTVLKNYLIDNLKDFIFVNVVKYLYLYLSIHIIFPWNVWKHTTWFNLLEFFHKRYKFFFYIVLLCVGDFWLRFWCMYITFLRLLS